MSKYETIPSIRGADEEVPFAPHDVEGGPSSAKRSTLRAVIGAATVLLSMGVVGVLASKGSSAPLPMMGSANHGAAPPCTFDECYASRCNAKVAPYTCLFHNGGPHGGCSPTPWVGSTCTTQCDLSGCADLPVPDDTASCNDEPCDDAVCAGDRLCETEAPYQCTEGSANFGCSEDELTWTLRTPYATCSSCCNTNTCA